MTAEEWLQELQEQLLEETAAGVVDNNYYDDSCTVSVEIDYTTQSQFVTLMAQIVILQYHKPLGCLTVSLCELAL